MADSNPAGKYSPGDPLKDLWNGSIDFREQFSQPLDVKYSRSRIKNWCHLAEKFKLSRTVYESFESSDNVSPSEKMLEHLERTRTDMKVSKFMEACTAAGCQDINFFFTKHIQAGKVSDTDKIADLWDKVSDVVDDLLLLLDRNRLWMDVAKALKIPRDTYETFSSDPTTNYAHDLFNILTIEEYNKPHVTVQDLKDKLVHIERGDVKLELDKESISESSHLKDVRGALYNIEQKLNKDKSSVYKLAQLYQKDGCLERHIIEELFPTEDNYSSPTKELIEYVIKAHPEERRPTIEDLIFHLAEINRDPKLIEGYMKGGRNDINTIVKKMENLQVTCTPRQPSTGSEDVVPVQETARQMNEEHQESENGQVPGWLC